MRRLVLLVIGLAIVLGAGYALSGGLGTVDDEVETVVVARGPLESSIELAGSVVAQDSRRAAFGTPGTVATVAVAEGDEVAADALLATLEATAQEAQLAAAEAALGSAEAAIRSAQSRLDADRDAGAPKAVRDADRAQLAAARAQVASARAQVASAREALAATELRAPIRGTIVALGLAVGDRVGTAGSVSGVGTAGDAGAIVISDLAELRVATTASEIDVVELRGGQAVTLSFDALPGVELAASICRIAATGRDRGGVIEFDVEVCLAQGEPRLRVGMSANVTIVLASVDDALIVPSQAIRLVDGLTTVRVRDADGTFRAVTVEVGISSGTRTQVVSGLAEGDRVVVGDRAATGD